MEQNTFYQKMRRIALPITVQSVFQAALSLIDQMMISDMGDASVAGVGLCIRFISIFSVIMSTIVTVAGILIAQYKGKGDMDGVRASFYANIYLIFVILAFFIGGALCYPSQIMSLYSADSGAISCAVIYMRMIVFGFIPQVIALMLSTLLRNYDSANSVMYASGISVLINTLFNYLLIYGVGVFPRLGITGAALATNIARLVEMVIILGVYLKVRKKHGLSLKMVFSFEASFGVKIAKILAPILCSELLWSLGENAYAIIYGHLGTDQCAAMSLTYPLQGLAIGALTGVSAAAGMIVGESLGAGDKEKAMADSKRLIRLTLLAGAVLSILITLLAPYYIRIFHTSGSAKAYATFILYAYALVFPGKIMNMVLGGEILRSGGQTKYTMAIVIGATWLVGVPLGFITAYLLHWPIYLVYFALSLEEYVRVALKTVVFKSRKWMVNLADDGSVAAISDMEEATA